MLIITRRVGESFSILIDKIEIGKFDILGIKGGQIRIGFDAERNIELMRGELFKREEIRKNFRLDITDKQELL